jgi:D-alanyl-D-alanine carboxypeptidase/D-alanyl-D-alanine-endopeptidase (penicillin-binding protein 4)
VVRICAVDDPVGFARALFIDCLRQEGIVVRTSGLRTARGELPPSEGYDKLRRVAVHRSLPLTEALKVTLKVSHNLYASTLPLLLAVKDGKRTQPEGMRIQGQILRKLGVDTQSISLESGAGGGNGDRVSPRATVQLLLAMKERPDFESYRAALPELGVDGTLASAVSKDSPARGKVFAKTGTYTDANLLNGRQHLRAKTLAGYLTTASGKTLAFALFVNDVALSRGMTTQGEGRVLGKLCEVIYQNVP